MANFCPGCGTPLDGTATPPAAPPEPVEVTLARIDKERAIEVARIEASARRAELATAEHVAEVQAEAEVAEAEAVAEIVTATAEAAPEPAPEPIESEPVIVTQVNDDQVDEDLTPPPVEHEEPREPRKRGLGFW